MPVTASFTEWREHRENDYNRSYLLKIDATPPAVAPSQRLALRAVAEEYEAAFLAEMLKPMGAAKARASFGGGIGEEQFRTLLIEEEGRAMAGKGGIGLAESIFEALQAKAAGAAQNG